MTGPAVVDLFSGAGGLSLGVAIAGGDVRLMVDFDRDSCATARLNHQPTTSVLHGDVAELDGASVRAMAGVGSRDPLVIVGGPPCQPFSKAAYWLDSGDEARYRRERSAGMSSPRPTPPAVARADSRRDLVQEYWRLVVEAEADAFVFENVPSILHPRNRPVIDALVQAARFRGYEVVLTRGLATDFGVAQRRERVFLLASRHGTPAVPDPTHGDAAHLAPLPTPRDVLRRFASRRYFEPEEVVTGRWADHLAEVPPGWNYKWHTAWAGHPSPTFQAETRFWNFLLKLDPGAPSWTLPASPGPWVGPFHWSSRRLRSVEYAALQGFPAGFRFVGDRRSRIRQIGNAVPPAMGAAMVGAVLATLRSSVGGRQ